MPPPFLRLDQLLLPPPLAALSGLLQACGIVGLGVGFARRLRGRHFEALDGAAGVVLVAAVLGSAVHGLALLGFLQLGALRGLAGVLVAAGVATALHYAPRLLRQFRRLRDRWWQWPLLDRVLAVLIAATALGLLLAALGPATDADSVGYHLGVPLEWLRHGGAEARPDWFVVRLIGVGDLLDLLGLAGGSDSLGAMLQWTGAIVAALAVSTFAHRERDRLLAVALVLSAPVLLSLVPAQKPQILPAAATAVALVLIVRRWNAIDRSTLLLAFTGASFAMSCKYSFLFSGAVVIGMGLLAARRSWLGFSLAAAVGAALLLAAPVYLRNFWFYGDPVSPFLERWRSSPQASLVDLADYLASYGNPRNIPGILQLIRSAFWRPISGALGVGCLAPLLANWQRASARRLLGAAAAAVALELAFGQLTPRFFLEPFFWSIAALGLRERALGTGWVTAACAQATLTAAGAATGAVLLFPGTWSDTWRDRVLRAHAPGYAESRWFDETLLPNDVLLTQLASGLFLPRPFFMQDDFDGARTEASEQQELLALEQDAGVSVLTVASQDDLSPAILEAAQHSAPIEAVKYFPAGTRNPLVHSPDEALRAFRLAAPRLRP